MGVSHLRLWATPAGMIDSAASPRRCKTCSCWQPWLPHPAAATLSASASRSFSIHSSCIHSLQCLLSARDVILPSLWMLGSHLKACVLAASDCKGSSSCSMATAPDCNCCRSRCYLFHWERQNTGSHDCIQPLSSFCNAQEDKLQYVQPPAGIGEDFMNDCSPDSKWSVLQACFTLINAASPSSGQLKRIFTTLLSLKLADFEEVIRPLAAVITAGSVDVYMAIRQELLPVPSKPHYLFNTRDLASIVQGVMQASKLIFHDQVWQQLQAPP